MTPDRPDLSPHIVHLTRDYRPPGSLTATRARDNLISILTDGRIEARTPYGIAVAHLRQKGCLGPAFTDSQKVACFSDTPLELLSTMISPGVWRRYHFQAYGLAFSRQYMQDQGANPVWYVNTYPGSSGFRWLAHDINELIDEAAVDGVEPNGDRWNASDIARLTPYIEPIGKWNTGHMGAERAKDFSWEREWRYAGDFDFGIWKVGAIIVPVGEADTLRAELVTRLPGTFADIAGRIRFVEMEPPTGTQGTASTASLEGAPR